MFPGILLWHRIFVTLFLLQYIIKLVMLLLNRKDSLAKYTKATRFPEILVSVAFLVTGIWLMVNMPSIGTLMVVKLVCVFAAIPLAIIGFKKGNKALAALAILLILAAYGLAEMNKKSTAGGPVDTSATNDPFEMGKIVYLKANCNSCHGYDGRLHTESAKDLSTTQLTMDEQKAIIKNGKDPMPAHPDLTEEQLNAVVQYISTFRK